MSITLTTLRNRIRLRLNDTDARRPTFDVPAYDNAIAYAYILQAGRLPAPMLYTASAFTIAAGASTFALPTTVTQYTGSEGGAEYRQVYSIQLASDGTFLEKVTNEQMDAMRAGSDTVPTSTPSYYSLSESSTPAVTGRCWPGADDAEVCNLWAKMSADDLRDYVGGGTATLDDVEVLFSRLAAAGLEAYVAADLLERMTAEDLALRRLSGKSGPLWRTEAERAFYQEAARRHDLNDAGRIQRWVG